MCDPDLARILCEDGVECIRELDEWNVGWAREHGRLKQVAAPGHDRPRCVYVDFLETGPAVARTLRARVVRNGSIRRIGDLLITDLAEHYAQVASYMRQLGMVPPSALPPRP